MFNRKKDKTLEIYDLKDKTFDEWLQKTYQNFWDFERP